MAKYRKKPIVVEAERTDKTVVIHTLEGDMTASPAAKKIFLFSLI